MAYLIEINDISRPELEPYAAWSEPQLAHPDRPRPPLFIAESPKVVERALEAGYEPVSMLIENNQLTGEAARIIQRAGDIPVYTADEDVLVNITGFKLTRGVLCAMKRKPLFSADDILRGKRRIAVLEEVMNPTNVGAIFRSAAALNIEAVLLTHGCSDPLYRRSLRVSMGNVFAVPWTFLPPKTDVAAELHRLGFKCAAMALDDNSISIRDKRLLQAERLAVVLGTEGDGLKSVTIDGCDYTVKIPMANGVDSLNVAAAAAVAFWQLTGE